MKLTPEVLKKISLTQSEPSWLFDQRAAALKRFEALPYPTVKDEEWKYTDIHGFSHADFDVELEKGEERPTSDELEKQGVVVSDLPTALKKHSKKIESLLRDIQNVSQSKFETLHQAFWQQGIFVYVPPRVEVRLPVHHLTQLLEPNTAIFPFTIALVESGASLVLVDEMTSTEKEVTPSLRRFSDAYRYLYVKEDASLQYVNIQRWGGGVTHIESQLARLERGAKFSSVNVGLGGQLVKMHVHTILEGEGAEAKALGLFFGNDKQHFDIYTSQDHAAPQTTSDLLYKVALKDSAQSSYQGIIHIPKKSQRSDAYQANKNLLLSQNAKARSIPKLEILADDVRCTHSATVGTVDPEETFYLESRGLSHEDAVQMVVEGFFEQIFAQIPSPDIQKRLHQIVKLKLGEGS